MRKSQFNSVLEVDALFTKMSVEFLVVSLHLVQPYPPSLRHDCETHKGYNLGGMVAGEFITCIQ